MGRIRRVTTRAIVIGCGGHSRAIINILLQENKFNSIELYDLNEPNYNEKILGIPVIGKFSDLIGLPLNKENNFYIAIGDNLLRSKLFEQLIKEGCSLNALISNTAKLSLEVIIGKGSLICPQSFIGPNVVIGENTIINTSTVIEHETRVGSSCHVAPGCTVSGRANIGDRVFIGAGASVIDGVNICNDVTIGAGATVIKSINTPGTYIGIPAKIFNKK